MLEKSFGLMFYLKKRSKQDVEGQRYLYFRITVDGIARDVSTKRFWYSTLWSTEMGRAMGGSQLARSINSLIETLTVKVHQARKLLLDDNKKVTADGIKDILLGRTPKQIGILNIFEEHNRKIEVLVGMDYALGTLNRYQTTLDHTRSYIRWKYQVDDMSVGELDFEFVSDFEYGQKYAQEIDDWSALLLAEVEEHFERIKAEVDQSVDTIDKAAAAIKSNQRPVHFSDKRQAFYYGLAASLPWSVVAIVSLCLFSWLISTGEKYQERRRIVNAYENAPQYRLLIENGEIVQEDGSNYLKLRPQAKKGDVLIGREYIFDKKSKEMRIPLGRK